MKNYYIVALLVAFFTFFGCTSANKAFKKDKPLFEASKTLMRFKSMSDMNDLYFEIRENNFFNFYRQLYDSIANTQYAGKFTKSGDTLILNFYHKEGYKVLGQKALINAAKNEIVFFDEKPLPKRQWELIN